MKKTIIISFILSLFSYNATAIKPAEPSPSRFNKKHLTGVDFNNSWTSISGQNQPHNYFYKPSLGFHLKTEYYVKPWLGLGIAGGFQQRGAGIFTEDKDQSLGNPDSTHRWRLRFNAIDFPLYIVLRTPKDVFKDVRFSLQLGINLHRNFQTTSMFYSLEDGFHNRSDVSSDFYKNSGPSPCMALSTDIDAGGAGIFQVQLLFNPGMKNVYNNTAIYGNTTGKNSLFGLQLAFLY